MIPSCIVTGQADQLLAERKLVTFNMQSTIWGKNPAAREWDDWQRRAGAKDNLLFLEGLFSCQQFRAAPMQWAKS